MTNRNYYQVKKEKLKEPAKIRYSNISLLRKKKRVKSIIGIGIVVSMKIKRNK